jgi:phage/plasmid-like protein (TIGR03299 family)
MAHGLMENDYMFSANGIRPWHGLGAVIDDAPSSADAIRIARLDWRVEKRELFAEGLRVPNYFATVRQDTKEALGIVGNQYKVVQNVDAFAFVDDIMGQQEYPCVYETAGSLWNGRRIFLLVKLPETEILGDKVENFLFFSNGHDGYSGLMCGVSPVRVVCNNTLQLALRSAKRVWYAKHTSGLDARKQDAVKSLGYAVSYVKAAASVAEEMVRIKLDVREFVDQLFPLAEGATKITEEHNEQVKFEVVSLHNKKPDLANFRGTGWGVYNAVADYLSNGKPLRRTASFGEHKMERFLDGEKLLTQAQDLILRAA